MKKYASLVLGGGPAGLTAALYLARFGLSVLLAEKISEGGLLLQTARIENYPGLPDSKGYELADAMTAQLKGYDVEFRRAEVLALSVAPGGHRMLLEGEWIEAGSVIICSGLTYRKLGLADEERLTGRGVSYCALCDGQFFRDRVVAVAGGGNAALEEALYLSTLAAEVHLIHRREAFRADKIYQDKVLAAPKIKIHYNAAIAALYGESELSGIRLKDASGVGASHPEVRLPAEGLFIFIGQTPTADFLPPELARDQGGFIITDAEMRTNIPGIFAAGDIRAKLCRQVITAAGDGATAATAAYNYLSHV